MVLDLKGMIVDGKKLLTALRKYRKEESVKAVLLRIDSPGGVVGPSQEIFAELKRTREEFKIPVVATVNGMAASGAYYSAVAADKIVTNPGSMLGSIGVIIEFANLEELYKWAKIKRYSLKTGRYKDAGAEYRDMTEDERNLFQSMINEVLNQFIKAVADGRKLEFEKVKGIADGRVFTGETAVKLGLADQIGTYTDALRIAGELGGLGKDPKVFVPPTEKHSPFEMLMNYQDEEEEDAVSAVGAVSKIFDRVTARELVGKPLFMMPGMLP
jgi:protease-4